MKHPQSTYRLQLKKDFGFKEAAAIVPYLAKLGISHVYCSPYLKARPGSTHGYDIVDHQSLNPELGSEDDYDHFIRVLKKHGMGQVLDIVPNHMGVGGSDNAIWLDVLENGEASKYAFFFDIDWRPAKLELRGKILLPFLGKPYGNALVDGDLQLRLENGAFSVYFAEHRFPIDPSTYPAILNFNLQTLQEELKEDDADFLEYQSLISAFSHLPKRHEKSAEKIKERDRDKEIHKNRLGALIQRNTTIAQHLEKLSQHLKANLAIQKPLTISINCLNPKLGDFRFGKQLPMKLTTDAFLMSMNWQAFAWKLKRFLRKPIH